MPRISAPAVNTGSRPVLSFRVNPTGGDITLRLVLNGTVVVDETFDTEPRRAWQEVVEANLLQASNNVLRFIRTDGPARWPCPTW